MSKNRSADDSLLFADAAEWRQRIRQLTIPANRFWPKDAAEIVEANAALVAGDILTRPEEYGFKSLRKGRGKTCVMAVDDLSAALRHVFHAGFVEAVLMHRRELMAAGDWVEWKQKQSGGGNKGRKKASSRSADLAKVIRDTWAAMEAAGENPTNVTVAAAVKRQCGRGSVSTVIRAFRHKPTTRTAR